MPHIFHMAFAENTESQHLRSATWGLPLYLLLLSLPILPITWAGMKLGHELPLDYTGLAIGLKLHKDRNFAQSSFTDNLSGSTGASPGTGTAEGLDARISYITTFGNHCVRNRRRLWKLTGVTEA